MPLTLVTGPANAAKAGAILDVYAEQIAREPILVVPNFGDVAFYQRDLALRGAVFGTNVVQFSWLLAEIGKRTGLRQRPVGRLARRRVAARAITDTRLDALSAAASTPGFAEQLVALAEELEAARIEPGRLIAALRTWGEGGAYADEVGRLYGAYRDELERLGRPDLELSQTRVLDELRNNPGVWGSTPVLFYGFDSLSAIQLDAVETLARHAGADVWFSLTYEAGREALAGRARSYQDLKEIADAEHVLAANDAYYESAALHRIERALMDPSARPVAPKGAVELLEGGGERAEAELVAGKVKDLLAKGVPPHEIAVVHRSIEDAAPLLARVLRAYEIPFALRHSVRAGHTALGRGLIAALRCALLDGTADDLVTYLRTPGLVQRVAFVDELEAEIRRNGWRRASDARAFWESEHFELAALDRIAAAARRDHPALLQWLGGDIAFMFERPFIRQAAVFAGPDAIGARTAAALQAALRELAALPPRLVPRGADLIECLSAVEVFVGDDQSAGRVTVAGPLAVRARRVRALFVMGMAQGTFPKPARAQPFFDDAERRAINAAAGLRLRLREQQLPNERFLFYMACSRAQETLALSWPAADDEGKPIVRSLFVDDLTATLTRPPDVQRRALGEAGWSAGAPSERERRRAEIAAAPGRPAAPIGVLGASVLDGLRERETWSASALEAWIGCPVKWFVERHLNLAELEPDPEPLLRGQLSHAALERALAGLDGPLTPADLPRAKELLHEALSDQAAKIRISVNPERLAAESRRLEADLLAYLEHSAANGSSFVPRDFELSFGGRDDDHPPLELREGVRIQGRIDRVDASADGTQAIVWDYKGRGEQPPWKKWAGPPDGDGKIQIALYMLALERVVGLRAVGGLYQRMKAQEPQARGMMVGDADPGLAVKPVDRVDEQAARAVLDACEEAAVGAVAEIREGLLAGRPKTCGYFGGGCEYPSICRCEESDL